MSYVYNLPLMSCRERELILKGLGALLSNESPMNPTPKGFDHEVQDIVKKIEAKSLFYILHEKDTKND